MPTDTHRLTPKQATQPQPLHRVNFNFTSARQFQLQFRCQFGSRKHTSAHAPTQAEPQREKRRLGEDWGGRASVTWYGLAGGGVAPVDAPAMPPPPPPGKAAVISPPCLAILFPHAHAPSLCVRLSLDSRGFALL
jgi:hypothetical protein